MSTVRRTVEATRAGTDPFDLTGKVALVTGAARGIGQSIAVELARRGVHTVVADLRDPSETVALLRDGFPAGIHEGKTVDVRERDQVDEVVSGTAARFGHLDILVNNAGTASRAGLTGITDDEWFRDLDTNLRGTFLFCRAAISPWMSERRAGAIINISSISGLMGGPSSGSEDQGRSGPAYAASKGGVIALTKWLAKEVGALGITVNSVAPGPIATPLTESVAYDLGQQILPRMGKPEEIGAAVAYLASPAAAYVTGQVLRVCGGAALG
ncbi:SDR family NAD(P)-dependent oxidoreductase [Streptomyces sp. AgN23]|uniref:SDR family NAD(P)-dependent oxidoreductase n=1 Tax=Streptomyces sp. AgN23 TaxID=1188315 RepID=UPI001B337415|nr:SDR family NAD(P)-dependent oxidoreductase [Streptomyces sp. AgN23]QTI87616.1 SDR family oxidoreductase [Streptomyces sp. AgN23]